MRKIERAAGAMVSRVSSASADCKLIFLSSDAFQFSLSMTGGGVTLRACVLSSLASVLLIKTPNLGQGFKEKKAFPQQMSTYKVSVHDSLNYK